MTDVYLAPGHGRRPNGTMDPGATAGTATEQSEGDLILRLVEQRLTDVYGLDVYRQAKGGPNFEETIRDINRRKPTVALELHHDWVKAPRGGFGFVVPAAQDRHGQRQEQQRIESAIRNAYVDAGLPTRKMMNLLPGTTSAPAILRGTTVPTMLWETDRIGAVEDHALYAQAIADGLATYLDVKPVSDGKTYRVQPGDTLSEIGARFDVSVDQLVAVNNIDDPDLIRVGDTLTLPDREAPAPPSVPDWAGKQVRAKVDLRFYDRPGWHPQNPSAGTIKAGLRFAGGIHDKRKVGGGEQYHVSNSRGRRVWITASPKFVDLV